MWPASGGTRGHPCGQGDSLGLGIRGRQSLPWMPVPVPRPGSAPHPGRDPSSVCVSSGHHRARLPTDHTQLPLGWAVSLTPMGLLLQPCHSSLTDVYTLAMCLSTPQVPGSGQTTRRTHFLSVFWKAAGGGQVLSSRLGRMRPRISGSFPHFGFGHVYGLCHAGTEVWLLSAHQKHNPPSHSLSLSSQN